MGAHMSVASIKRAIGHALEATPPGDATVTRGNEAQAAGRPVTMELMVHPGYPSEPPLGGCGQGPDLFSQSPDRRHELDTLRDPRLHTFYSQERVQLCAFRDL